SIEDIQTMLSNEEISSVDLVRWYIARIEAYDAEGPSLNAIQYLNPLALAQAKVLDEERKASGPRSLLHGIPLVIKDNYETIDAPTTAGSAILAEHWPKQDATQVARLRQAGAIVLAKANMHEFAYGWTTRGSAFGMTRNPYNPTRHPGGSSGGTGAAVTANLATAGMGSDTCGSIRIPSAHNNLVGLRGTQGISSRSGIIPLSSSRDVGGPLARSVRDLAILLDSTVGYDPLDSQTSESLGKIPASYLDGLEKLDLKHLRIGVLNDWFGPDEAAGSANQAVRSVLAKLRESGAQIVELSSAELKTLQIETTSLSAFFVDDYDLKRDLPAYLAQFPSLAVQSFADLSKDSRLEKEVSKLWQNVLNPNFDSHTTYLQRHADGRSMRQKLLTLMSDYELGVLVYPTATEEAVLLGNEQSHFNCKLAPASGLPAISVPAGFSSQGLPLAIELLAEPWAEQKLLNLAYTIEQVAPARQPPRLTP
ncbi:MAG: amidase, partial [Pseudomonadales bacterium]|nr:amidase [Pseudomonadales bacterium]